MSGNEPKSVAPADPGKKTSAITEPAEATVQMSEMEAKCYWNDEEFAQGDRISADGTCYECAFGKWVELED